MIGMALCANAQAQPAEPLPVPSPAVAPLTAARSNAASVQEEVLRGQSLFTGTIDLQGRIYTHTADMPPSVVRCANCHAVADGADVPRSLAPRLTRSLLVLPHARRGGPPSNYSRAAFCTLLRRGIDPAFVMISVAMPRYTIDDENCGALWRYLTGSGHEEIEH